MTSIQQRLDFPVRKSTRLSNKNHSLDSPISPHPIKRIGSTRKKNKDSVKNVEDKENRQTKTGASPRKKNKEELQVPASPKVCDSSTKKHGEESRRKKLILSPKTSYSPNIIADDNVFSVDKLSPAVCVGLISSAVSTPPLQVTQTQRSGLSSPYASQNARYKSPPGQQQDLLNFGSKVSPRLAVQLTPCDFKSPGKLAYGSSPRKVSRRIFDDSPTRGNGDEKVVESRLAASPPRQPLSLESLKNPASPRKRGRDLQTGVAQLSILADSITPASDYSPRRCKDFMRVPTSIATRFSPRKFGKISSFDFPDSVITRSPRESQTEVNTSSPVTRSSPRKHAVAAFKEPLSPWKCGVLTKPPVPPSPAKSKSCPVSPRKFMSPTKRPVLSLRRPDATAYQKAKQALHTAMPGYLVGRDQEIGRVRRFLTGHLENNSAGSLYISGAPGTGKTAVVTHVLNNIQEGHKLKSVYINCMSLKDSAAIFTKIVSDLTGRQTLCRSAKDAVAFLTKHFTATGHSVLLILDEIDQLDSHKQEVLYTMFEWPSLPRSRLLLIGIANALDLTDRMLPRLQARPKCRPDLMNFTPYTKDQIVQVIQDRLKQLSTDQGSVLEPSAVQFCARKVSAVAGDMRKALDVCRRAVEMVEKDVKSQSVLRTTGCPDSPVKTNPAHAPNKKIGIKHISAVVAEVYSSSVKADQPPLPLQQKLVICSLLLMMREARRKTEITVGKLHEMYSRVCRKRHMTPVDQSEFHSLCNLIETRGILVIKKTKDIRSSKIVLKYDLNELEHSLQDKMLISSILKENVS